MSDNKSKRRAVIVGINEYKDDDNIPHLEGAENDANDIYEKLKEFGTFEIPKKHILTGKRATCKNIRKAISDVFYHTHESCEVALFYFSGHGIVDPHYNVGYIAPYDMIKDDPFVNGIKMMELKEVISNSDHNNYKIAILDCCHSGIVTRPGDKSVPEAGPIFEENIEDFSSGEGIITLASSEEDEKSREIKRKHRGGKEAHTHGTFTYYLLEGLEGEAADDEGKIYLPSLGKYIEEELEAIGKQKYKFSFEQIRGINNLQLSICSRKFDEYILARIKEAEERCKKERFSARMLAVPIIIEVLEKRPKKEEALLLKKLIDENLAKHQACKWLKDNWDELSYKAESSCPIFEELLTDFPDNFNKVAKLDNAARKVLAYLLDVINENITKSTFIELCRNSERSSMHSAQLKTVADAGRKM